LGIVKTILVTGGTGFLGKHLIEQLRRAEPEARLRILCRGASRWGQDPGVEVARGDITSPTDVARAMEGAAEVYHLAGVVSRDPRDGHQMYQAHVEGTRHVCEAALRHGAQKVLVASSSGTVAVGREPVEHREDSGYKHEIVGEWPYYLSKIYAEKLALLYFKERRLPVVVANPSLLLGPGDERRSSTGDIALFLDGQILSMPLGGLNFVDARDAAAALIGLLRRGRPGERYLLGGPNWTFRQLIETLAGMAGVRAPRMQLGLRASLAGAAALRRLYPLFGKRYGLDDVSIRMSALYWYCNSEKARSECGFQTRDPAETLRDTVNDLR